jgi:hypothetical protein
LSKVIVAIASPSWMSLITSVCSSIGLASPKTVYRNQGGIVHQIDEELGVAGILLSSIGRRFPAFDAAPTSSRMRARRLSIRSPLGLPP